MGTPTWRVCSACTPNREEHRSSPIFRGKGGHTVPFPFQAGVKEAIDVLKDASGIIEWHAHSDQRKAFSFRTTNLPADPDANGVPSNGSQRFCCTRSESGKSQTCRLESTAPACLPRLPE